MNESDVSLKDEELLRGFHVLNLIGGNGSIQFTKRTILRELPDGRFMLSEREEMDLRPENVFSGDKKVGTTDSNVIAIDTDEVKALVRKVRALEAQSLEGLRAKIKARKRGWEAIQREDEPKNDIILDNVDEAIITEYETILRLFDAKPTENTPT
ncbi:MAG: hypothetical protein JRM77_06885 [Nitrososphaerota archaeon]|nr:hypothetical protein [Nitrososphaerota archaeon]